MVCSNKKDGVSHGGLKTMELEFQFLVILVHDVTGSQIIKINHGRHCCSNATEAMTKAMEQPYFQLQSYS
jgi:hypothetical protein